MTSPWFQRGLLVGLLMLNPLVARAVDSTSTTTPSPSQAVTVGIAFCEGYDAAVTDQLAAFDAWKGRLGVTTTPATPTTGTTSSTAASASAVYNLPPTADVPAIVTAVASDVQTYVVLKDNAAQIRYSAVLKGFILCPEGTYIPDPVPAPVTTTPTTH